MPDAPVFSATANETAVSDVPACTVLRKSLSSDAAASLIIALTRAALTSGSFGPASNQIDASAWPPRALARSRAIFADEIFAP